MKKIKKVVVSIIIFLLLLIIIFNIYNYIELKVLKKDIATIGGYTVLEVVSGSMEPTIHVGDYVIVNTNAKGYKKGDIISFFDDGIIVTHRLVSINKNEIVTKGDANNSEDEPLPANNIIGKYVMKLGGLGKIVACLKNPFISIMIFIIGVLICILVSTDKDGNPILDDDQKEFQDFLEHKELYKKEIVSLSKEKETKKKSNIKNIESKKKKKKRKKKKKNIKNKTRRK